MRFSGKDNSTQTWGGRALIVGEMICGGREREREKEKSGSEYVDCHSVVTHNGCFGLYLILTEILRPTTNLAKQLLF